MDRDRRNQMILVVLLTVMAVAVLYATVISWLNDQIRQETKRLRDSEAELQKLAGTVREGATMLVREAQDRELLNHWESRLPQGPAYAWLLRELEPVAKTNGITEFALVGVSEDSLPFPAGLDYQGLKGTVFGVGAYQQLGMLLADFENAFPFNEVTILNLDVSGMATGVMTSDQDYPVLGMQMNFRGCGYKVIFR